jgi:hypothetical protein
LKAAWGLSFHKAHSNEFLNCEELVGGSFFPEIEFAGQLRPSQQEVFEIAKEQLSQLLNRVRLI